MQVHGRRFKPHPWNVQVGRVAQDCQWSWRGLILGWPLWHQGSSASYWAEDPINGHHGYGSSAAISYDGMPATGGGRGSVVRNTTLGTSSTAGILTANSSMLPTSYCSVVMHYRKTDATQRNSALFGLADNPGDAFRFQLLAPFGDGNIIFDYGGTTNDFYRAIVSAAGVTFGDDVWICTCGYNRAGRSQIEVWHNGVRIAASTGGTVPGRSQNVASKFGIFNGLTQGGDLADAGSFLLYDRQLDISEIRALSRDPWTPFRERLRRGAARSSGGGGGSGARIFVPAFIG